MWCHLTTQEEGHYQTAVNTCNAKIHPPLEAWPQLLSLKLFFLGGRNRCSEGLWFIKVADQFRYSTASLFFRRMLFSLPLAQFCQHVCAPSRTSPLLWGTVHARSTDMCPEGWPSMLLSKAALRFTSTRFLFVVLPGTNTLLPEGEQDSLYTQSRSSCSSLFPGRESTNADSLISSNEKPEAVSGLGKREC